MTASERPAAPAPSADPAYELARDLLLALAEEWCNGCRAPKRRWGPVCPGMQQGDWTHFHSREFWLARGVPS